MFYFTRITNLQNIFRCLVTFSIFYCLLLLLRNSNLHFNRNEMAMSLLKYVKTKQQLEGFNVNGIPCDRWQKIGNPKTSKFQIYSAYFDERLEVITDYDCPFNKICYGSVRVIALLWVNVTESGLHCNFMYSDGNVTKKSPLLVDQVEDWQNFRTHMIVCVLEQNIQAIAMDYPVSVGLTYEFEDDMKVPTSFTKIRYPRLMDFNQPSATSTPELAVCVPAFQNNYGNTLRIVEFVEMWKLLGATKIYFYNSSISSTTDRILRYYNDKKIVEIFSWHIGNYNRQELFYNGISACFHDCYYRASFVDNVKYIALLDIDEIMMPMAKDTNTLLELVRKLEANTTEDYSVFSFRNVFIQVSDEAVDAPLYSQQQIKRTQPYEPHYRSKMLAKGKYLIKLSNHFIYKAITGSTIRVVKPEEGLLFHYRYPPVYNETYDVTDSTNSRYSNSLNVNVQTVCREVFDNEKCPTGV